MMALFLLIGELDSALVEVDVVWQMWPDIIAKAKEGGANVVQTYVFWSGHEPQKGQVKF